MIFPKFIEWIFWILFWIESFSGPIQTKDWISKKRWPIPREWWGRTSLVKQLPSSALLFKLYLYPWMCYTEIHVETTLTSILWCCLPSLPHLSSLLLLFLQLSRVHLLQQCRVAGVWLLRWRWIYYMGWWVHICTKCWGCPYQHLDKAACQLGLAGKGKGSSDMVLDWTKEKSALLKPIRIFSDSDLD